MTIKKAGTILLDLNSNKAVLVVRKGKYSFPKGHLEEGETIYECAIRETIEETGHECFVLNKNNPISLSYLSSKRKRC